MVANWEEAGLLTLICDVQLYSCHFPISILGQVWCLIESIPDLGPLSYFHKKSMATDDVCDIAYLNT